MKGKLWERLEEIEGNHEVFVVKQSWTLEIRMPGCQSAKHTCIWIELAS